MRLRRLFIKGGAARPSRCNVSRRNLREAKNLDEKRKLLLVERERERESARSGGKAEKTVAKYRKVWCVS